MNILLGLSLIVTAVVIYFLLAPLWQAELAPAPQESAQVEMRYQTLQRLSDLEIDYSTQKIDESDFLEQKKILEESLKT